MIDSLSLSDNLDSARRSFQTQVFGKESILVQDSGANMSDVQPSILELPYVGVFILSFLILYLLWVYIELRGEKDAIIKKKIFASEDAADSFGFKRTASTIILHTMMHSLLALSLAFALGLEFDAFQLFCSIFVIWLLANCWSALALVLMSYLVDEQRLYKKYTNLKLRVARSAVLIISPFTILINFEANGDIMLIATILMLAISYFLLFFKGFLIFSRENISILHWISYLCAVELLPFALAWGLYFAKG